MELIDCVGSLLQRTSVDFAGTLEVRL